MTSFTTERPHSRKLAAPLVLLTLLPLVSRLNAQVPSDAHAITRESYAQSTVVDITQAPYYASPYGATVTTTTAAVEPGATTITVRSCNSFRENNGVLLAGGGTDGWSGRDYIGVVASCRDNTLAVYAPIRVAVPAGAAVQHDESAALNTVTARGNTGDVSVYFPPIPGVAVGMYRVNGAFRDRSFSNSIVLLPNAAINSSPGKVFRMFGPTRPVDMTNGVVIQTDYAGPATGALFGVRVNGASFGGFNNSYLAISNLRFVGSAAAPSATLVDCGFCKGFTQENAVWYVAGGSGWGLSFRDPLISNDVDISAATVTSVNFGSIGQLGEHSVTQSLHGANTPRGIVFDSETQTSGVVGHANTATLTNGWMQLANNCISAGKSPQTVVVASLDCEVVQHICDDPGNLLTGDVSYNVPYDDARTLQTMLGPPLVNGCSNLRLHNLHTGVCYGATCPGRPQTVQASPRATVKRR